MSAPFANRKYAGLAIAAGAVFLFSVLAVVLMGPPEPVMPSAEAISPVNISRARTSSDAGNDFVARPLFVASRRRISVDDESASDSAPVVAQSARGEANPKVLDKVVVHGTFASGESAGAIVGADGRRYRLRVGEVFRGWELAEISEEGARFEGEVLVGEPPQSRSLPLEHAQVKADK